MKERMYSRQRLELFPGIVAHILALERYRSSLQLLNKLFNGKDEGFHTDS